MNRGFLMAACIAIPLMALAWNVLRSETPPPCANGCNVIVVVVDTLAASHLSGWGYDRDTMPLTETFFREHGITFRDASSASSWTFPAFASLYFSDIPSRITFRDLEGDTRPNLFRELRNAGIAVHADLVSGENFIFDLVRRPLLKSEIRLSNEPLKRAAHDPLLSTGPSDKFFYLIHTFSAHDPYDPKPPFSDTFVEHEGITSIDMFTILASMHDADQEKEQIFRLRYDQQLRETDEALANLLRVLLERSPENTAIFVTADHGEAFREHGLYWHGNSLFQEVLHVPLFAYIPGVRPRTVETPVSLLDIAPTALALSGIQVPKEFVGIDLRALLSGEAPDRAVPFAHGMPFFLDFGDIRPGMRAPATLEEASAAGEERPVIEVSGHGVRFSLHKLFIDGGVLHLYDLKSDPLEKTNNAQDIKRAPHEILSAFVVFSP